MTGFVRGGSNVPERPAKTPGFEREMWWLSRQTICHAWKSWEVKSSLRAGDTSSTEGALRSTRAWGAYYAFTIVLGSGGLRTGLR